LLENSKNTENLISVIFKQSFYRTVNKISLLQKNQSVSAV